MKEHHPYWEYQLKSWGATNCIEIIHSLNTCERKCILSLTISLILILIATIIHYYIKLNFVYPLGVSIAIILYSSVIEFQRKKYFKIAQKNGLTINNAKIFLVDNTSALNYANARNKYSYYAVMVAVVLYLIYLNYF